MRKENFKHLECPLARSLDIIGEWWSLLIVRDLFYGVNTFDLICEDLGIARNILTDRLKKFEDRGIIEKWTDKIKSRGRAYRLTKKGKDLIPCHYGARCLGEYMGIPEWATHNLQTPA